MIKQNVNHHSDEVVNKTIEKDVGKHSNKSTGDNLDKFDEFIFDNSEENIKVKILRILKKMQKSKENLKQSIIFLKEWKLARFTLTLNLMERMKKIWSFEHQYLEFCIIIEESIPLQSIQHMK